MATKSTPPAKARVKVKAPAKPKAKARAKPRPAAEPPNSVSIRMYRQGLGDCFLLTFRGAARTRPARVLIDCGVFQRTPGEAEKLRRVAADVALATGGVLDLLVVTHEHWDHVSGFAHARSIFEALEIRNVWLSWAEDPGDPDALALKSQIGRERLRLAESLARADAFAASGLGAAADEAWARRLADEVAGARGLLDFFGPGGSDPSSALAAAPGGATAGPMNLGETMEWLRARVRPDDYRSPGDCLPVPGFEGARAYVLGPPRSLRSIRKEDPSAGQSYGLHAERVSLVGALEWGDGDAGPPGPFEGRHRIAPEDAALDPFFREHYGFADDPLGDAGDPRRRIDDEWLGAIGDLALQLDTGVNNTSLALAFELPGGQTLIFPGDAQMGSWLSWGALAFRDPDGRPSPATTERLLGRAAFYKVGHHGSHNATLKPGGLEAMTGRSLVAMVPTDQAFARSRRPPDDGWKMPSVHLREALVAATAGRVLLADEATADEVARGAGWRGVPGRVRFAAETFAAVGDQPPRPLYVEYTLPF